MKASCVLCGHGFAVVPDLGLAADLRDQKMFAELGRIAAEHLTSVHRKTVQQSFDDPKLIGPLPIPALIGAIGMCAQNAAINAHLKSDDAAFQELNTKLIELVKKGIAPVVDAPVVSLV